jgi:translation initiation factor 5A
MDLETFEVFDTSAVEQDIMDKVHQGGEVEYWKVLERIKVARVKN